MGLVDFVLRRPTPYKLRKGYDRLRERADKIRRIEERLQVLRSLDQIEPSIVSLEEHHMSNFERKRIMGYVASNLRKIKFMLEESKHERKEKANYLKDSKSK